MDVKNYLTNNSLTMSIRICIYIHLSITYCIEKAIFIVTLSWYGVVDAHSGGSADEALLVS